MSLQVIFLGTAGSIPTSKRSLPAVAIRRKGELILFDCGEGVQRQMVKAGLGFNRKMKVLITHMHGDHMLGLPGMIQTMSLLGRTRKLEIYGPVGLEDFVKVIEKTVQFALTFPLEIAEIEGEGLISEEKEYEVYAACASHVTPAFAYNLVEKPRLGKFYPEKAKALGIPEGVLWSKLQHGSAVKLPNGKVVEPEKVVDPKRPGRKIVYTGDSRSSKSLVELAKNADLLIHDCTFDDELAERAEEDGHSTPSQAAKTAKKAKAKRLILTHISARYKKPDLLLNQARKGFSNVDVAEDFMKIDLPLLDVK
ncbi:MAG: ribonuclease Z [Candidatus Bathyarchaeota archaeon]|nr:ribonuclease Z [Candidatus Bathyarchaeota archaeon]MDH5494139.1 ribonuclease Z [Candidatus Bathyarchaeota archaeon]